MIPRYNRDQDVLPTALFTDAAVTTGAYQNHANLTTALYTFEEASRWTVHGEGLFIAQAAHVVWIRLAVRVTYNLNGAGWTALAVNPNKQSFLYAATGTNNSRQGLSHSWRWPFAFVGPSDTIQFRLEYYVSGSTISFTNAMLYVDVDRG